MTALPIVLGGGIASALDALPTIEVGWKGSYIVGRWSEVLINVSAPHAGQFHVRVAAPDPDGHLATYVAPSVKLEHRQQVVRGLFKVGRLDSDLSVELIDDATQETVWTWKRSSEDPKLVTQPLSPVVRLVVTAGQPIGFDLNVESSVGDLTRASRFQIVDVAEERLPENPTAYDGVSSLVLAAQSVLTESQAMCVRDWVAAGGRLVISLPTDLSRARQLIQQFSGWLPVGLAPEPITASSFGKLELYAGRNVRIPFTGRLNIPHLVMTQGEYLAGSRDEPMLVRSPYGLGSVTVLALDLTQPPLSKWSELPLLCRRLAESSEIQANSSRTAKTFQLGSTGVSDIATQLHAAQEDFADVSRASPWFAMGLLGALLLIIGPLDYVIVHRILQRPRSTWITFPLLVIGATAISAGLASRWNGLSIRVNQLNLLNVDVETSTCHQRLWTNVYSNQTSRHAVSVSSTFPSDNAPAENRTYSSWSGIAESSFGGMLRPVGLQTARANYDQTLNGIYQGLPLLQWSSKELVTEVGTSGEKLIECDLQTNGTGRLSGTLTHRFPAPIEDWILVHGNRVYRQLKKREDQQSLPMPPKQIWRVEQPNVFQREIRAFLTGQTAVAKKREGDERTDILHKHVDYDTLSRDPAEILRMLTFHAESGGRNYTGLTNTLLETEDLSHLVKLGRAVLFGQLKTPIAKVQIENEAIVPSRESTFVRIILPVKKVGSEFSREIERFDTKP